MADSQDRPDNEPDGESRPPIKKAPPAKRTAKAPAKKAPAKKAPAKKAPAKKAPEPESNTNGQLTAAAKTAAAQAKSNVDSANDPVAHEKPDSPPNHSPVPWVVAVTLSLLAMLLVRQLRRR